MTDERQAFRNRAWEQLEEHPYAFLVGLYVLCLLAYVATIPLPRVDGQLIGSDGVYYYAYLPSLLLDGDLDLSNQYARLLPTEVVALMGHTATGLLPNAYAIGSTILWAPFFLLGHALALSLHAAGRPIALDGMGTIYQAATLIGSLTYGFLGLMLIYSACRLFFGRAASALAVMLIWLGTNVLYYMIAEPSMSHNGSLFANALFLALWLRARRDLSKPSRASLHGWALLGLAGGLVALVRLPDATVMLLPVLDALARGEGPPFRQQLTARNLLALPAYALGFLVGFAPQMASWQVLYGSPLVSGYLVTDQPTFAWLRPKLWQVFFSPLHGLYLWHPLALLATAGLAWLYRKERLLALWLALGLAMQAYVIGSWRDWGQGDAFGGRMFISTLPGLALGLGALLEWAAARRYMAAVALASAALVVWNGLFMLQYRLGYVAMGTAPTLEQFTVGKLTMLADLARRIVHR